MADQKISQLTAMTVPTGVDLLVITDDPTGTPVSKSLSLETLFANIPSNTSIEGTLTVASNTVLNGSNTVVSSNVNFTSTRGPVISAPWIKLAKSVVSSNNAETQLGGGLEGSMFWDENYLYIAVSNTVVKRTALSTFSS
tara:strand:- start:55 stop:474 length:420 start_codon:yes stop_codon:yes gene_type:complete